MRFPFLNWVGRHELAMLVLTMCVTGCAWAFATITDRVFQGDTSGFDTRILLSMRSADDPADPIGPRWVEELGRDFTALGGVGLLTLITIAVVGLLVLRDKRRTAAFVVVAIVGGVLLSTLLKMAFSRPRPDLVPHDSEVYTASFPSGHSLLSAVVYLTLGALLAQVETSKRVKAYLIIVAMLLTFLVGMSRVYVGVHWPTDVLAGWTAGAAWATCCLVVWRWWNRRAAVM